MIIWSAIDVCAPDILGWNVVFLVSNFLHVLYLAYKHMPPRINPDLYDLYEKLFKSIKVSKHVFKDLEAGSQVLTIMTGEHYALEGITSANHMLSILLRGR